MLEPLLCPESRLTLSEDFKIFSHFIYKIFSVFFNYLRLRPGAPPALGAGADWLEGTAVAPGGETVLVGARAAARAGVVL